MNEWLNMILWDQPSLKLDAPEIWLKISEAKVALSVITEKKRNLIQRIADKIFKKAEERWGILLNESKKSQFKLGLQAAMDVENISESQRYTIIWHYAQGFLSASPTEPIGESKSDADQPSKNRIDSTPQESQISEMTPPIAPVVMDNPETLGRELLSSDSQVADNIWANEWEISLWAATQEVQVYNTQTAELKSEIDNYRTEAAIAIENEQKERPLERHDIPGEQYNSILSSVSLWDPVLMANIPEWETRRVNWADENGATQVQCTHLSDGDFVLSFPDGEMIIIDSNWDSKKAGKEIEFIQEVAKTPIIRRLLNMGNDSFYRFRDRVAMRYDPEWKTIENPELLIKLMLEAILQIAMDGKDTLNSGNNQIYSGEFRDPTTSLTIIQSRLYGSGNENKRIISEALSKQWIFDIQSRKFNIEGLIARI